ncbi:MAG: Spy/CpxP family protein refolding chaperone [Aestuariivirgaceae bacterium]
MNDHLDRVSAPDATRPSPKGARSWLILPTIALAAALTGAAAGSAVSDYNSAAMPVHFMGGHDFDPAKAEDRADRMVRHIAIEVDATNEQTDKLRAIMKATVKDLVPLREKIKSARERVRDLLTAPTIDRAAIEQLRSEQMANIDAASRRIAQGLADSADVLSVEQRRKFEEKLDEWRERRAFWRPWHRG